MKRYKVTLTDEERQQLQALIAAGSAAARKLTHARLLLKADASPDGPAWADQRIVEALDVGVATGERVRQRQKGDSVLGNLKDRKSLPSLLARE